MQTGTSIAGRVGPPQTGGPRNPTPGKPPALASAPDPSRLLQALKRRWLLAVSLGLTLSSLAAGGAFVALAPKNTAYSTIRISPFKTGPFSPNEPDNRYAFNLYRQMQVNAIKGPFVLEPALKREEVKRLNLEKKYGPDLKSWLGEELKIESAIDSEIIRISLMIGDAEEAKTIVNAVAQTYMKEVVDKDEGNKAAHFAEQEKVYNQANNKLREKQNSLKAQAEQIGTTDADAIKMNYNALVAAHSTARNQYNQVAFDLLRARGRLEAHKLAEKTVDKQTVSETQLNEAVESDPLLKAQIMQLQRLRELIDDLKKSLKDPYREPRFGQAVRAVEDLDKKIATRRTELRKELEVKLRQRGRIEYDNKLKQLESEVAPLRVQADALNQEVERLKKEMNKIATSAPELENLKQEIAREGAVVADLGKRMEVGRYELLSKSRVSLFGEPALMPLERKKQIMGTAGGLIVAFGASLVGVAIWEFRRRRIHSTDEVATGLGIPVVGALPTSRNVEQMINAPAEEVDGDPLLTESVDAIRTQLLHAPQGEPARVLMVTSAGAGEGKTTLAGHLAASLSRAGRKTLLIDGDLRQPAVHQIFEAPLQPGFSEAMLGEADTVDAILATNVDGMMMLPAGQYDREVLQSLARGGVQGILEKLKDEFDFIVIDSHPVLSANDSLLIGKHVDAVILSVLREVSEMPKVYAAAQRLNSLGIRVLGAVVNATDPEDVYAATAPAYSTAAA